MYTKSATGTSRHLKYRGDIDGLRAVAIVLVILYHAGFASFPGGYIGVDVFFVISGYLITKLISEQINTATFSFSEFYLRRVRRLAPAAAVVVLVTSVWCASTLDVSAYSDFGHSLVAFIFLGSNWFFSADVNYFSPAAEVKPLLHTWSLGVEEQFYLVFPALILLLKKRGSAHWVTGTLVVLALCSFLYAHHLLATGGSQAAFFNSFARFWELLAGGILATYEGMRSRNYQLSRSRKPIQNVCSGFGVLLIVVPAIAYTKNTAFPGIAAVPIVVGTVLVIACGGGTSVARTLSSNVARYVGRISYGWYLWHWPVFIAIQAALPRSRFGPVLAIAASLVLAAISFHFIEQPVRRRKVASNSFSLMAGYIGFCFVTLFVGVSGVLPSINYQRSKLVFGELGVVQARLDDAKDKYLAKVDIAFDGNSGRYLRKKFGAAPCSFDYGNSVARLNTCIRGNLGERSWLVIGDSIGRDTLFALRKGYPNTRFAMLHQSSCIPVSFKNEIGHNCFTGLNELLMPLVAERRIQGIILAARVFPEEVPAYLKGIENIQSLGLPTVVIAGAPSFIDSIGNYVSKMYAAYGKIPKSVQEDDGSMVRAGQDQVIPTLRNAENVKNFDLIDIEGFRCAKDSCRLFIDGDFSRPLIFDREHMTLEGIDALAGVLTRNAALKIRLISGK